MTEDERKTAHLEWLKFYTWIQEAGDIDFHRPRVRPKGLLIDQREIDI